MEILSLWALLLSGLFGIFSYILLMILLKVINRLAEVNKQLLIVVAGQNEKPEALRALVASDRPPKKNIPGIADGKKKKDAGTKNTDYTMEIGVH